MANEPGPISSCFGAGMMRTFGDRADTPEHPNAKAKTIASLRISVRVRVVSIARSVYGLYKFSLIPDCRERGSIYPIFTANTIVAHVIDASRNCRAAGCA